jgi:hypothetical protein
VALLTPDHVVLLTNNAELTIARRDATAFEIERRYDVSESQTWAVPVLLGRDLLIRDETHLVMLTPG